MEAELIHLLDLTVVAHLQLVAVAQDQDLLHQIPEEEEINYALQNSLLLFIFGCLLVQSKRS